MSFPFPPTSAQLIDQAEGILGFIDFKVRGCQLALDRIVADPTWPPLLACLVEMPTDAVHRLLCPDDTDSSSGDDLPGAVIAGISRARAICRVIAREMRLETFGEPDHLPLVYALFMAGTGQIGQLIPPRPRA